jgi:histidyl-tRNA synthetase
MLGLAADIDYLGRSLKAQMKQADRNGFRHTFLLADEEMSRGLVIVRDMTDSRQFEVELSTIYAVRNAGQFGELIGRENGK